MKHLKRLLKHQRKFSSRQIYAYQISRFTFRPKFIWLLKLKVEIVMTNCGTGIMRSKIYMKTYTHFPMECSLKVKKNKSLWKFAVLLFEFLLSKAVHYFKFNCVYFLVNGKKFAVCHTVCSCIYICTITYSWTQTSNINTNKLTHTPNMGSKCSGSQSLLPLNIQQ